MLLDLTLPLYSISILSGKLDVIKLKNGLGLIWQVKKNTFVTPSELKVIDTQLIMWCHYFSFTLLQNKQYHVALYCSTVEPRLSVPYLSGFLDYPDFFSSSSFVMNIYY